MIELAHLGVLIVLLMYSITLVRRYPSPRGENSFQPSMIELAHLGVLIVLLMYSITLVRRYPSPREFKDL
jgi:hypothetical protein